VTASTSQSSDRSGAPGSDGSAPPGGANALAAVTAPASADAAGPPHDEPVTRPLLAISNAMVRIYKQAFGRGPTKTRARFAGPDMLVLLLQDGMTVAERNLVTLGERTRVREHRLLMHDALEDELRALVETTLDRRVATVISGMDPRDDLIAVIFVLEPAPSMLRASAEGGHMHV
jgi:uncharacterized protein YbcI